MTHDASSDCMKHHLLPGGLPDHRAVAARFADIPLSILHGELQRRQAAGERPACGSDNKNRHYDFPLHVFALFLILILSTLACSFPLIVRCFPKLPVPHQALFISRHFGTGVLIATAFVHLFPTAYTNLTNPCLAPFWTDTYPAMPGFIAMVSVLVVVGIEMFFAAKGAGHSHHVDFAQLSGQEDGRNTMPSAPRRSASYNSFRQVPLGDHDHESTDVASAEQRNPYVDAPATPTTPESSLNKPLPRTPGYGGEEDDDDDDLDLNELDPTTDDMQPLTRRDSGDGYANQNGNGNGYGNGHGNGHARPGKHVRKVSWADEPHQDQTNQLPTAQEQRLVLQCLMLEAGILFHSVFIGLAVSVSTGSAFVVLLLAISFHQTFEGLALGSRIASIGSFSTSSWRPWLMCLMYGITTPIGQAIGLGVQGLYDPASELGLLMVGIMNAISSGLLLYAGLVQLLAEDFLSEASYEELQGKRRIQACAAVIAGCMLMALVGVWA